MNRVRLKRVATALALAAVSTVLVGCGARKSDSNPVPGGVPGPVVPGGPGGPAAGACAPITGVIPFTAQGIYFSYANIVGGLIPGNGQQFGTVVVGGQPTGGPYQRNAVDLNISMNLVPQQTQYAGPTPTSGFPSGYQPQWGGGAMLASGQGMITINPMTQQQIMYSFGGGYGYGGFGSYMPGQGVGTGFPGQPFPGQQPPSSYGQQVPCVSGIAFSTNSYSGYLFAGVVWLYLNGTQHGVYYPI